MLKRRRSSLAGGLTSSCRIKAEALARAFNSRLWPCTWRSTADRRQEEDEEFYEASPVEDDDWGGRGPDRSAATDEGRAKLYELLHQHAVDDATDVFYDVSENAGDTETARSRMDRGLVQEVIMHEPCEKSNGLWESGESSSESSKFENVCEAPSDVNECRQSSTISSKCDDICRSSCGVGADEILFADSSSRQSSCDTSNAVKSNEHSPNECQKFEDSCETSNDSVSLCVVNKQVSNESSQYEDVCETFDSLNDCEQCTECSKDDIRETSDRLNDCEKCTECSNDDIRETTITKDMPCTVGYSNCEDSNSVNGSEQLSGKFSKSDNLSGDFITKVLVQPSLENLNCEINYEFSKDVMSVPSKYEDNCETDNGINDYEKTDYSKNKNSCNILMECKSLEVTSSINQMENTNNVSDCLQKPDFDDHLINCDSVEKINLNCSVECINTEESPSVIDSGNAIDSINVIEPINTTPLILNSPVSLDISINFDSDYYAKSETTDTEMTSLTNSFEYLHHETNEDCLLNTIKHHPGIQNWERNDSDVIKLNELEDSSASEFMVKDISLDFNSLKTEDSCGCIDYNEAPLKNLNTCECLSDISHEQNTQTVRNTSGQRTQTTMDIVEFDSCHFDQEEFLTVIIDSDTFNIHQTHRSDSGDALLITNLCVNEQEISLPLENPECPLLSKKTDEISQTLHNERVGCHDISCNSSSNIDEVEKLSRSNPGCPLLITESNGDVISTIQNECSHISEQGRLEDISQSVSRNDQSTKVPLKEAEYTVSIQVTKEGNSPTHENELLQTTGLDCVDSPVEDSRLRVFDENRPMISRSTSLKTGKTPPGTPSRKKIVRFADVLGLDLEDVRHIISGDLPNIPSSAYNDLVLGSDPFPPIVRQSVTVDLSCRRQASWESVPGVASPNALYPLFAVPGLQADFMEKVKLSGICLESVVTEDCNVQCTCRVMNWGYNKKVLARYTTNGWLTSCDINASYVTGSTRDGTDSFAFNIFLNRDRSDLQFALRYEINGNEYWDNNGGKNYCFSYHGNSTSQTTEACSPTWMGQFW